MSWKDEDENNPEITNTNGTGIHAALQNVSAVMESPGRTDTCKRKRGRPPIDDYDYMTAAATAAKVPNAGTTSDDYSNDAPSPENHSSFDDEAANCDDDAGDTLPAVVQQLKVKPDYKIKMEYVSKETRYLRTRVTMHKNEFVIYFSSILFHLHASARLTMSTKDKTYRISKISESQ